jgi:hypothetical protein
VVATGRFVPVEHRSIEVEASVMKNAQHLGFTTIGQVNYKNI